MDVPIIVVEDRRAIIDKADLAEPKGGFQFKWHPSARVLVDERAVFERFAAFLSGHRDDEWGDLSAPSIVVLDLGYSITLTPTEVAEIQESTGWPDEESSDLKAKGHGFYLLGLLLQNQRWNGLAVIATTQFNEWGASTKVSSVRRRFPHRNAIVHVAKRVLPGTGDAITEVLNSDYIGPFLKHFGPLEKRLWPDDTANWFSEASAHVQHDPPPVETPERSQSVLLIREYLRCILGYDPPERWFEDAGEFKSLWDDLKHLVGSEAVVDGRWGGEKPPTKPISLGNVLLLLAAECGEHARRWLEEHKWTKQNLGIRFLPSQTTEQMRDVVFALTEKDRGLFPQLVWEEELGEHTRADEYGKRRNLVLNVSLDRGSGLQIYLDHDFSNQPKLNRPSLLEKIACFSGTDGGTYSAFRRFQIAVSASETATPFDVGGTRVQGHDARCVVNFYLDGSGSVLEIRPCLAV